MVRWMAAAIAALALGACSISTEAGAPPAPSATEGYTLQIVAEESAQIYLVTHSDGRSVAAKVENGQSALMDAEAAADRVEARMGVMGEPTEGQVHIRFPGVSISVAGQDHGGGHDRARIAISAGGHDVLVDAEDSPRGEDAEKVVVRIPGVSAEDAREFIDESDKLSAEVKAQMRAALGL